MRPLSEWLAEYAESHQDHRNEIIHWFCVPLIFFSIFGLLDLVVLPIHSADLKISLGQLGLVFLLFYYMRLSKTIWIGMLIFGVLCMVITVLISDFSPIHPWIIFAGIFVLAWIGQFYGHKMEGRKPSFLKDVQFLLIGPAWLMSFIYKRLGVRY